MTLQELIDNYGLDQIRDRTRISVDNILNLLNEDYESSGKTNALGFYKILEREFDIDFSQQKQKLKESINEHDYVPKELLVTERKYASTKRITSAAFFLIILAAAAFGVVYMANSGAIFSETNRSQSQSQQVAPPAEEETLAIERLPNVQKTAPQPEKEPSAAVPESNTTLQESRELDDITEEEEVQNVQQERAEVNTTRETEQSMALQEPVPTAKEAGNVLQTYTLDQPPVVRPKSKMWLGYIDLDSGKRVQKNKTDPIVIEGNNTIIVTGHGHMAIGDIDFATGQRLFFHYEDGELKRLNEAAFKQRNEGRLW